MHLHHSISRLLVRKFCLSLLLFSFSLLVAQPQLADSLESLLNQELTGNNRIDILISLAEHMQYRNPAKGILYAEEAYELAEKSNDTLRMAGALSRMSSCYESQGTLDKAEEIRRKALALYLPGKDPLHLGKQYANLATLFDTRGDLDSAAYYYQKTLDLYYGHGTQLDSAVVYNNLGIIFERQARYPMALETYLKALNSFEKAGRDDYMSFAYANMGNVYQLQGELLKAKKYYLLALPIKKKYQDKIGEAIVYNNISKLISEDENIDSAIFYLEKSRAIREEVKDTVGLADVYTNLGKNHLKLNHYEEAEEFLIKAYNLSKIKGIKAEFAKAAIALGKVHLAKNNTLLAKKYLQEGLMYAEDKGEPETRLNAYHSLAHLYREIRDPRGFEYYDKYILLEDSLRNDELTRELTRLEMQSAFDKEKETLALAQQKKEFAFQAELERQRFQRNIGIGALGSGLIILALLWRSYRVKQKNNRLLELQKSSLEIALEDRENLLKEIHHRVKNNLQVVSSLLSLQSRAIHDPAALEAIEEGRNRVKAMGLIHQNLYQDDNLVGVNLAQYLEKLTQSLLNSYKVESGKVHITRKIDAITLDVDTLIPLGLILNELISNSLKYAFENRKEGNIRLEIARKEKGLLVQVEDDGVGLPESFNPETCKSMGYKLIKAFVKKMKASLEINTSTGTQVLILLPESAEVRIRN